MRERGGEEQPTVPEASYTVHSGHFDDKGKHIIDEGIESFVGQHSPRQVSNRFQFVVDKQLWSHRDKTCALSVCACAHVCMCAVCVCVCVLIDIYIKLPR